MRTDKRFSRVRDMLTAPEVPRAPDGRIGICLLCQRSAYFAGDFIKLLARDLQDLARFGNRAGRVPGYLKRQRP